MEPSRGKLSIRQTALDLCNREANQNKQVILFVPTKNGCEHMVSALLGFVDEAYAGRGVLGGSSDPNNFNARSALVEVRGGDGESRIEA